MQGSFPSSLKNKRSLQVVPLILNFNWEKYGYWTMACIDLVLNISPVTWMHGILMARLATLQVTLSGMGLSTAWLCCSERKWLLGDHSADYYRSWTRIQTLWFPPRKPFFHLQADPCGRQPVWSPAHRASQAALRAGARSQDCVICSVAFHTSLCSSWNLFSRLWPPFLTK